MVGVPGRSKGCNTCRKRKIRCDAGKPHCQRCISTGRQCEGYAKYPTFMIWTQDGYQPRSRLDDMKPSSTSSPASNQSSDDSQASQALIKRADNEAYVQLEQPSSPKVWSEAVSLKFLESLCPSNAFYTNDPGTIWVREAITSDHGSKPLELVLQALASVRVGFADQNDDLRRHGTLLYGKALKALQQALYDPQTASQDYTFVAARAMVMYEHYMSTSATPTAWASHVNGLMLILMNRGSAPFATLCGQAAMEDVRDTMMIKSYMERKRFFLVEPQWMNSPWSGHHKDYRQRVCDIGLQLGALLEDFDNSTEPVSALTNGILAQILHSGLACLGILHKLEHDLGKATVAPSDIAFSDAQTAIACLHTWALQIGYRQLLDPVTKRLLDSEVAELPPQVTRDIQSALDQLSDAVCLVVCHRILAGANFLLQENTMAHAAGRRLAFPLLSAMYHLKSVESLELAEANTIYTRFKNDKGVGIASQLGKGVSNRFDLNNVRGPTGIAIG